VKLATALLSVPRPEGYVHQTIRSLGETGFFDRTENLPLRLVTGTKETDHLEPYRKDSVRFLIDPVSEDEAREIGLDALGVKPRCAFGHYRAMRHLLAAEDSWDVVLVCEDDVRFCRGWIDYLARIVEEIERELGFPWLLTLYRVSHAWQRSMKEEVEKGARWFRVPQLDEFWGTQAIVYSKGALRMMPEALLEGCIRRFVAPVDLTIGRRASERNVVKLASVPCLVQHMGDKTTGQSEWFHQADYFVDSVAQGP